MSYDELKTLPATDERGRVVDDYGEQIVWLPLSRLLHYERSEVERRDWAARNLELQRDIGRVQSDVDWMHRVQTMEEEMARMSAEIDRLRAERGE